jgi:hypothetical protein
MKYYKLSFFIVIMAIAAVQAFTQIQKPVTWNYSAKKLSATSYEIHLTATLKEGWHIYSQSTPYGGPVATNITFSKNSLVVIKNKANEVGKLEVKHELLFGVDVKQFANKVDFVQAIQLKAAVKTNISGIIESMACNDNQCLPPTKQSFSISLQ